MNIKTQPELATMLNLQPGEKLAFGITLPDGKTTYTILLDGDEEVPSWDAGMAMAKERCADLPDRAEQALFYKYMSEEFKQTWYWSNTQHAGNSNTAWYQDFSDGGQYDDNKSAELRVRFVRRVTI